MSEAVAQRCSVKKMFLQISKNSQENTCARVSFLIRLFKKETLAQVFYSEFCEISKNIFFTEHLRWLLLWFILVASIVATWVSWFSGHAFKLEAEDFIFHILKRNFQNFGVKILALCSAKVFRVFIFPYFVLSWYILVQSMKLFKVWLKRSQNGYLFFFFYLQVVYNCSN